MRVEKRKLGPRTEVRRPETQVRTWHSMGVSSREAYKHQLDYARSINF